MTRALFALLLLTAGAVDGTRAQALSISRIEITSHWTGYSPRSPLVTRLVIRNDKGVYRRGRQAVAPALIDDLTSALSEPPIPEPTLDNFGITQAWLNAKVEQAASLKGFLGGPQRSTPAARALFRSTFIQPASIAALLRRVYNCTHTDDYPSMDVVVSDTAGNTKRISSSSQCVFMLPWSIEGSGVPTFNAHLSRAVAALMPKRATNAERFSENVLLADLADRVAESLEPQFDLLDVEARAPGALDRLRAHLTVRSAEINQYHHLTYGTAWDIPERFRETNLHVRVHDATSPPNLVTWSILPVKGGEVAGIDSFLVRRASYEARVLAVPWLRAFIENTPQLPVSISYVQSASLGDKALRNFVLDMTALGRTSLANEVAARRTDTVLLLTGMRYFESYWLLLPDDRLVLWRHRGPSGMLRWKPSDFRGKECSEHRQLFEECVGAVVGADGTVQP